MTNALLGRFGAVARAGLLGLCCSLIAASPARAERAAAEAPKTVAAPGAPEAAAQAPASADALDAALGPVVDPDLAPPPVAPQRIRSWREALSLVRARSPLYLSSYADIQRAEAAFRSALSRVLPVVNAQGTFTHQFFTDSVSFGTATVVVPPQDVWGLGVGLNWSIVDLGAYQALGTARQNVDASRQGFSETQRQVASSLVDGMLATLAAERVAELNRVGLRAALERQRTTELKLQYKQGTPLDVERAEQDVATARADLINGDESLRRAREALGVALGSTVPLAAPDDLDLTGFVAAVAESCTVNADIEQRSDVARARTLVTVAERRVEEARLGFAPTLGVSSNLLYNSQVTFGPKTTWDLQGVLNVPVFEGGVRVAALRDARASLDQARQALVQARLNALTDSAQAARSVSVLGRSRDVASRQRDLSRSIDQRTREGYAHGLGTSLDLVVSAQALRQAETQLVLLEFQLAEARAHALLSKARCWF